MESQFIVQNWGPYKKLTYPILLDRNGSVWSSYGMGYIPHNTLIDSNWVVQFTNYGYDEDQMIDIIDGLLGITDVKENDKVTDLPDSYQLYQNYPNPFNSQTSIKYYLSEAGEINITIFNLLGEEIKTIESSFKNIGNYIASWDGKDLFQSDVASGVYFYKMTIGDYSKTNKLSLIR